MDDKKLASPDNEISENPEKPGDVNPEEAPSLIETQLSGLPKSQALLDIEADEARAAEPEKPASDNKTAPQNLAAIARFRWVLLFVLSLAAIIFWTVEANVSDRPHKFIALGYLAASLILTIPTMKILRIPTRGGLAALLWAGTFFLSAFYGAGERIWDGKIPAALPWGALLIMILLWEAVAVWRKVGRYKVVDIVMSVIIVYAALSPVLSLSSAIAGGNVLALNFQDVNSSPAFISGHLPWFLWPMTALLFLCLPLAAIFSLWDQLSVLKRRGARHGGNLFLALAFLLLIPYGFLNYDRAVSELPEVPGLLGMIQLPDAPPAAPEPAPAVPQTSINPQALEQTLSEMTARDEAAPETPAAPEAPAEAVPPPPAPEPESPAVQPDEVQPPAGDANALQSELNAAKDRINALERQLESLSREVEQMKRGRSPIPAPPDGPPTPLSPPGDSPLSSST